MSFINPFTAKPEEITAVTDLASYDPSIHTLIDGTVLEIDVTGAQRFSNGKTLVDTVKHAQSIDAIESLTSYGKAKAEAYDLLSNRVNAAQSGFRKFLEALWESGLDQDKLTEILDEHDLPTPKKTFHFSGRVTITVSKVIGHGKNEDEAWDNLDTDQWSDAIASGDFDAWSIDEPYSYSEVEEQDDEAEDPDWSEASIFDLT